FGGLARGGGDLAAGERAELGADQDAGAALTVLAVGIARLGREPFAGPRLDRIELDGIRLVLLVHAGGAEILEYHHAEVGLGHVGGALLQRAFAAGDRVAEAVVARGHHAVGREALHGERPGDADFCLVLVGPVV